MKLDNSQILKPNYESILPVVDARHDSGKSTEDSDKQIANQREELTIYASSDSQSNSDMQIIEHYEKFIGNRLDAKNYLAAWRHNGLLCLFYMRSKVKTLRKHTKIISE